VSADKVFPMHFWKDSSVIERYISEYGNANRIAKITTEGQWFNTPVK
jgi:hypothetical protein